MSSPNESPESQQALPAADPTANTEPHYQPDRYLCHQKMRLEAAIDAMSDQLDFLDWEAEVFALVGLVTPEMVMDFFAGRQCMAPPTNLPSQPRE